MKRPYLKPAPILISLGMLCSLLGAPVTADQAPDPAASRKEAIERMHHKLHDDQMPFKTQEAQALKELNEMSVREDVKIERVNAKIDELMAAKTQIMRLRYAHLIEMRAILSKDQKVEYDKALMGRSAVR